MTKFNLAKEIMVFNRDDILAAIASNREFGLSTKGEVLYPPFDDLTNLIFKGQVTPPKSSALSIPKAPTILEVLGSDYRVVEDEDRILIKAGLAWNDIIPLNSVRSHYDDSSSDGIAEFGDEVLEEIGWQADEFNITYREMVEVLEEKCDGVILCIEQEEPYQFSGLGFIHDMECARQTLFDFCQKRVKDAIANDPDFARENLTDDEAEAAAFFKV